MEYLGRGRRRAFRTRERLVGQERYLEALIRASIVIAATATAPHSV